MPTKTIALSIEADIERSHLSSAMTNGAVAVVALAFGRLVAHKLIAMAVAVVMVMILAVPEVVIVIVVEIWVETVRVVV